MGDEKLEFFSELVRARGLLATGETKACLEVLQTLKDDYKRGAKVIDLLGDLFLNQGDIHNAVRYKTYFDVLRRVLEGMDSQEGGEHIDNLCFRRSSPSLSRAPYPGFPSASVEDDDARQGADEEGFQSPEIMPVTLAIGKQYLSQGHFDLAIAVFERLLTQNPMDQDLHILLNEAKRRKRRDRILQVLQKWLANIENMKSRRQALT